MNFDEVWHDEDEGPRELTVRGERMVLRRAVRPEEMAEKLKGIDAARGNPEAGIAETMEAVDEFVVAMLEPEFEKTWRELRARETDGLSPKHILDVQRWIVEKQTSLVEDETGHPTGSPRVSSPGRGGSDRSSTAGSSSRASRGASRA